MKMVALMLNISMTALLLGTKKKLFKNKVKIKKNVFILEINRKRTNTAVKKIRS